MIERLLYLFFLILMKMVDKILMKKTNNGSRSGMNKLYIFFFSRLIYNQCVKSSGFSLGIFLHVQFENHQPINEISFNSEDILIQFNYRTCILQS